MENLSMCDIEKNMSTLGIDKLSILGIDNTSTYDVDKTKISTPQS